MNDDKNRDWIKDVVSNYAMNWDATVEQQSDLEYRIRSHIPPQPPIAEDVRELAHRIAVSELNTDEAQELIQSFSAEQQNIGSRLMAEQVAQSYITGAGRFSFTKEGDANHTINKMLDEVASVKEQTKETIRVLEQAKSIIAENDTWHQEYDEYGGYDESHLAEINYGGLQALTTHLQKLKEKI